MGRDELQVVIAPSEEGVTVALIGEAHFDFDTAEQHIHDVLEHKAKMVIVDASRLTFISSIGMCFLLNLRRALLERSGHLKLAGLRPLVRKALEHAHVLHLFDVPDAPAERRGKAS